MEKLVNKGRYSIKPADKGGVLTDCQLEVLRHLAEGHTVRITARMLAISERTLYFHISGIKLRLVAHSTGHAIYNACKLGIL